MRAITLRDRWRGWSAREGATVLQLAPACDVAAATVEFGRRV